MQLVISERDDRGLLAVDLKDLLPLLPSEAAGWTWTVRAFEGTPRPTASEFIFDISDRSNAPDGARMSTEALRQLANSVIQVVEGTFEARSTFDTQDKIGPPLLTLEVEDSDRWTVATDRSAWLSPFKQRFNSR